MRHKKGQEHEDELLDKAIRGDREGIEYLVNKYKDFSYTIALGIVANREDAEEVVQDSFMKAFASLGRFRKVSRFSTWLYRIVCNTAKTKAQQRRPGALDLAHQVIAMEDQSWDLLKKAERKKYVELALRQLDEEDRLIVTLYYTGEQSIAEICQITGSNGSAIKMRLLRSRKQLEAALKLLLDKETRDLL